MSTKLTYTGAEVQELLDKIEKGDFDNAKTLEGHPASYFAIASEFTSLAESFATEQGRINTLYSYFNNGSANDALRLGGQLPSYYATATQYEILQQTLSDFKSLFDSMFEKDADGNIHAKLSLWSSGGITAGGVGSGGSGGGGISHSRLDSWADYSADKSGYVLSAALGYDINTRLTSVENAGYVTASALAPYILRSEVEGQYLSKNGGTMARGAGIFNESDPNTVYGAIGFNTDHNAFGSPHFPTRLRSSVDPLVAIGTSVYTILHSGNYSRLLAGGTINGSLTASSFIGDLTGTADRALALSDYYGRRTTSANIVFADTRVRKIIATSAMTTAKPPTDGSILHFAWDNDTGWNHQLFIACGGDTAPDQRMAWRAQRISEAWVDWKPIAFIDSNVASATKLATPRTIWGQPFDGTGDITGPLHLGNNISLRSYSTSGSKISTLILDPSNTLLLGYDMSNIGGTVLYGKALAMRYGTSRTMGFLLNEYGNVAIGGATADTKLHVYGNGKFEGSVTASSLTIGGATLTYDSVNEALCINGNMYALGGVTAGSAGISAYTSLEARVARLEQQLNIS